MLFVFDTNILVSAILKPEGIPAIAILHAMQKGKLIFSKETEYEFREVVVRDKFEKYLPKAQRLSIADQKIEQAEIKAVSIHLTDACKDPKDIKFLNVAVEWKIDCIVSGDKHLLDISPFMGIPILTPIDFLKSF